MKRGAYIVNTARGKICDRDAIVRALESGQLAAMRAMSGSAASAEGPSVAQHAASWHDAAYFRHVAVRAGALRGRHARNLECYFEGRPIRDEYLIVDKGKLAGTGAHSTVRRCDRRIRGSRQIQEKRINPDDGAAPDIRSRCSSLFQSPPQSHE